MSASRKRLTSPKMIDVLPAMVAAGFTEALAARVTDGRAPVKPVGARVDSEV